MKEYMKENFLTAVIVLADRYTKYPNESVILYVLLIWIIEGEDQGDAP